MQEPQYTSIKPQSNLFELNLKELWVYRDLIYMYVKRDIVTFYKQTIMGPLWFVIQPILTTVMFIFVFGNLAGISTDGIPKPLFYFTGVLIWNYFADCLTRNSKIFIENQGVFGKVYFPRLVVPVSITISNLVRFFIQLVIFLIIYFYYYFTGSTVVPNAYAFLIPLLIIMAAGLSLGFGVIFSSLELELNIIPVFIPTNDISSDQDLYSWTLKNNLFPLMQYSNKSIFFVLGSLEQFTFNTKTFDSSAGNLVPIKRQDFLKMIKNPNIEYVYIKKGSIGYEYVEGLIEKEYLFEKSGDKIVKLKKIISEY